MFYILGVKTKVGVKTDFGPFFAFFHVQSECFTPTFSHFFSLFSRLTCHFSQAVTGFFDIFSRVQKKNHGHTSENFHVLGLFFHVHYLSLATWRQPLGCAERLVFATHSGLKFVFLYDCLYVCLYVRTNGN